MTAHQVVLDIARIEAAHLAELVTQFAELVDDSGDEIGRASCRERV